MVLDKSGETFAVICDDGCKVAGNGQLGKSLSNIGGNAVVFELNGSGIATGNEGNIQIIKDGIVRIFQ